MPMHRLSTAANQVWFTDDGTVGEKLEQISLWWSMLNTIAPEYGYNPNAAKSWLIVKEEHFKAADPFLKVMSQRKTEKWKSEIEKLSEIAKNQPHAAYTALTKGLCSRWNFLLHTVPNIFCNL